MLYEKTHRKEVVVSDIQKENTEPVSQLTPRRLERIFCRFDPILKY